MGEVSHEELLENLFDGVYYVDLNRRISFWNKAPSGSRGTGSPKSWASAAPTTSSATWTTKGERSAWRDAP